ncbi:MAG: stage IV sporulation protein A, partial [Blautia sp.]
MDNFQVYKDIQARTKGEIYIGVVGPVRTGKSTFIRRFMEQMALPVLEEAQKKEVQDQLPLSGSGKLITTVEPKFIPKDAVDVTLSQDTQVKVRLIDCVGFLVQDATGNMEEGKERMVKTPWFAQEIPFHEAAEMGTQKVIQEHSTIGLVITKDGSFGEIPRENYIPAEERTIQELQKQGKPFLVLINSQRPYQEDTLKLAQQMEEKYHVSAVTANCEQLRKEDVVRILEKILYEFPLCQIQFYVPKWVEMLPADQELKSHLLLQIQNLMGKARKIRDITQDSVQMEGPYVQEVLLEKVDLATGIARVRIQIKEEYYYEMLSQMTGVPMES